MIELAVDDLHLTYGDNPVLKGVSMNLKRGEVVSLLGPSGSGKTTLLRAVAGLEKPTQGSIVIGQNKVYDGTPRSEVPAEERNLGLVFQSYALWPHKTVFENVAYPLKLRKVPTKEIQQRVQDVLDQLGLGHLGKRHPHQLSGGQQQRVAIGRALVYNPPVILLDEPLSNLDAKLREEARVFLRELIIKLGLSALMVTHDQNEAMSISDRILLLNRVHRRRCTVRRKRFLRPSLWAVITACMAKSPKYATAKHALKEKTGCSGARRVKGYRAVMRLRR